MLGEILDRFGRLGVAMLKTQVSKVASSGDTGESIYYETSDNGLQLIGRAAFASLETGRGPRKNSESSGLDTKLDKWLDIQGFPTKTSKTGVKYYKMGDFWFSAKSLAWKMNKEGDKKWRQGHGAKVRDVYSSALAKFVELLEKAIIADKISEIKTAVKESLKAA